MNDKQLKAFKAIQEGKNVFITGCAGTGKSTLLREIVASLCQDVVVCAPTGIAAINVGGYTIHSLFYIAPSCVDPADLEDVRGWRLGVLRLVKTVIVDEVSMLRVDLLNLVDARLRDLCGNRRPFGGKQMVFVGDLYQLPPVMESRSDYAEYLHKTYGGQYFFTHPLISESGCEVHELDVVYRQSDPVFIDVLNDIRSGRNLKSSLEVLNSRICAPADDAVRLLPTNKSVDVINVNNLRLLAGPERTYRAKIDGVFPQTMYPTDTVLNLKSGARVMMLKNENGYVNGTMAKIVSMDSGVQIKPDRGETITCGPSTWDNYKIERRGMRFAAVPTGSFTQLPMRLAWAITIHKSQGQSFDEVHLDVDRGAFASGQVYVGLSRCRTLDGLTLGTKLRPEDIIVDESLMDYRKYFSK